jgi:hypothetical protein
MLLRYPLEKFGRQTQNQALIKLKTQKTEKHAPSKEDVTYHSALDFTQQG